jgi:hypothetical protein
MRYRRQRDQCSPRPEATKVRWHEAAAGDEAKYGELYRLPPTSGVASFVRLAKERVKKSQSESTPLIPTDAGIQTLQRTQRLFLVPRRDGCDVTAADHITDSMRRSMLGQ